MAIAIAFPAVAGTLPPIVELAGNVQIPAATLIPPAVTSIPPAVTLTPVLAVTIPSESTLVTSS